MHFILITKILLILIVDYMINFFILLRLRKEISFLVMIILEKIYEINLYLKNNFI